MNRRCSAYKGIPNDGDVTGNLIVKLTKKDSYNEKTFSDKLKEILGRVSR